MNIQHIEVFISPVMAGLKIDGREVLFIEFVRDGINTGAILADFFRSAAAYCDAQKIGGFGKY